MEWLYSTKPRPITINSLSIDRSTALPASFTASRCITHAPDSILDQNSTICNLKGKN
ncbi:hypothetical protein Mapa_001076 [Marchantia paleacea]|nr:hypothetical protein Mapa_001076 [Marchantia paleacea]